MFSASKQTATDRRARLGEEKFEQLQVLKFAWRNDISDFSAANEQDEIVEYMALHGCEITEAKIDEELGDDGGDYSSGDDFIALD